MKKRAAMYLTAGLCICLAIGAGADVADLQPETTKGNAPPLAPVLPVRNQTAAPAIRLKAPKAVEEHNIVTVEIENAGGPVRDWDVMVSPDPGENNTILDGEHHRVRFTGAPGVYTIRVMATGVAKGFSRQEIWVGIVEKPRMVTDHAPAESASDPATLIRRWAECVPSANRQVEQTSIAEAALEVAKAIREGRKSPARAVDDWSVAASFKLGPALAPWLGVTNGKSFFQNCRDLFADAATAGGESRGGPSEAALLEHVASVLQGNK